MFLDRNKLLMLWYFLCRYIFVFFDDRFFVNFIRFINYKRLGKDYYVLNYKNPKTFNEKINVLKFSSRNENYKKLADKYLVRKFVKEKIGEKYLIPIIGVYDSVDQINFEKLPKEFALKTNHGSGWNLICDDKSKINWPKERRKFQKWLKQDAFYLSREYQYKNIPTKLICEKLIGYELEDYKFFCFNGKPKFIQIDKSRFSNHKRSILDTNWNKTGIKFVYDEISGEVPKPENLQEMIEISSKLSEKISFCRIDLYSKNNNIYFGEITFFPEGGQGPFDTYFNDLKFGNYLKLSDIIIVNKSKKS